MKAVLMIVLIASLGDYCSSVLEKTDDESIRINRPGFRTDVKEYLQEIAEKRNQKEFQKAHILPWSFIRQKLQKLDKKEISKEDMKEFIKDLSVVHEDAGYLPSDDDAAKDKLQPLSEKYKSYANDALDENNLGELKIALFNMPSNLYPGNIEINNKMGTHDYILDPPKKGSTDEATKQAKYMYEKYKKEGLKVLEQNPKRKDKGLWVLSSDNLEWKKGDSLDGCYINIE